MNAEEELKKHQKAKKYDGKPLPKLLKYLGKIKSIYDYDEFSKKVKISVILWIVDVLIFRPILIWIGLLCLLAGKYPLQNLILPAVGISIIWDLVIEFKRNWKVISWEKAKKE